MISPLALSIWIKESGVFVIIGRLPIREADLADDIVHILILTRKLLVDPEELLAFVHHADETTEARVFGFEQGVKFAQG